MRTNFYNSLQLTRLALRRERISSTVWIVILVLVFAGLAAGMYTAIDAESRAEMLGLLENPAMIAMVGPAFAANAPGNYGALYTNMMLLFSALTVGIMNIFFIVRHTRADEEKGRYEVLRSLPTGRMANLHAAIISAVLVNVILAVLTGLSMFALGDASMTFGGSMLWGAGVGAAGLVFAAIAALFCQLSSNSRSAITYSFVALILLYFIRVPGDMAGGMEILALLSPLGLVLRTQVYILDLWWPIFVMLGSAVVITVIAYRLNAVRDIDQGILPDKPGKAHGGFLVKTPFGLSIKLTKTAVIWVVVGMFILGASYASILADIDEFVAHNEMYQNLLLAPAGISLPDIADMPTEQIVDIMRSVVAAAGFTLTTLFASMVNNMMAMFGLAALIVFTLKAKGEEKDIRAELILATPVCRNKFLGSYVIIAAVTALLLQLALAIGLHSVGSAVVAEGELPLGFLLESALVYVPAMWVMIGITLVLVGWFPKHTGLIWAYYGYSFLITFIGRMGIFPDWIIYTTPLGFVPQLPMEETSFLAMAVLTLAAVALGAIGFVGYNRRDINAL